MILTVLPVQPQGEKQTVMGPERCSLAHSVILSDQDCDLEYACCFSSFMCFCAVNFSVRVRLLTVMYVVVLKHLKMNIRLIHNDVHLFTAHC